MDLGIGALRRLPTLPFLLATICAVALACGGDSTPAPLATKTPTPTVVQKSGEDGASDAEDSELVPVIFVPGITGSILRSEADSRDLWPPGGVTSLGSDFRRLSLNPSIGTHERIFAPDVIRIYDSDLYYDPFLQSLTTSGGYVEYESFEDPEGRTTASCFDLQEPIPSLFVFAYDWRLAIEDNARLLADYVGCVHRYHPGQQVNIVTHSMGGLVARRYIIDNPGSVNKLITVAAPFLGSPKPLF